jgi:hypothetical protein
LVSLALGWKIEVYGDDNGNRGVVAEAAATGPKVQDSGFGGQVSNQIIHEPDPFSSVVCSIQV